MTHPKNRALNFKNVPANTQRMKATTIRWAINAFIVALAASISIGAFMGLYTGNSTWFLLCIPLLIFLS